MENQEQAQQVTLQFPADHKYLALLGAVITAYAAANPQLAPQAYPLQLAVHEALTNIIEHGYRGKPGAILVRLQLGGNGRFFSAELEDQAPPYSPEQNQWPPAGSWQRSDSDGSILLRLQQVPDPGLEHERGRGLFLISQLMDDFTCKPGPSGNFWHLVKNLEK